MSKIDRLIVGFIHECGKMDIESLKEFRANFVQDSNRQGADIGKLICGTIIDLVIEKKREKFINGRCEIATES